MYAADKVSKVRELRMLVTQGLGPEETAAKLRRKSLEMLDQAIPRDRVAELLRFELEAIEKLPPERPA